MRFLRCFRMHLQPRYFCFAVAVFWLVLAGCSEPTSAQLSHYGVENFFVDPKAQALAVAAEYGDAQAVHRLMKDEEVNPDTVFSKEGMPLLAWPIFTHNPKGLQAMLENGADPNARKPGRTIEKFNDGSVGDYFDYDNALIWAAKQEDPIYLKLLLDHGGDPNTRNVNDETLLFQAFIWHSQWQNVQLLVERGADIDALTRGVSILGQYAGRGGFKQAYWLLEHGADITAGDLPYQKPFPAPARHLIVEDIFWHPGNPEDPTWQRKCQQWLLARGFRRPPMPDSYREMRKNLGFPYEEKNIPLL